MSKLEKMLCKVEVKGAEDKREEIWATDVGMGVYSKMVRKFVNPLFTPVYIFVWDHFIDPKGKINKMDENSKYTRMYVETLNKIAKRCLRKCGGINMITRRMVVLNFDYLMEPTEEVLSDGTKIYIIKNMISVGDMKT